MTFAHPWLLLLCLPAAAAAAWAVRDARARRAVLMPASPARPGGTRAALAARLPALLQAAALCLVAVALARPQRTGPVPPALGMGIDIMLALDTSISMTALDLEPDRLGAAKKTAKRFIKGRAQDRMGLVVFGGGPMLACPLTLDAEALLDRLDDVSAGMAGPEGTALGEGIASAVNHLRAGSAKSKIIVLLTDGRGNVGIDAVTAAKAAAAFGIKIYAVGAASKGDALIPADHPQLGKVKVRIEDDLDEDLLAEVARLTNGRFYRAESLEELGRIYAEIDRLERSEVKLPPAGLRVDLYRFPLAAALLLLLVEAALSQTVLLRWP